MEISPGYSGSRAKHATELSGSPSWPLHLPGPGDESQLRWGPGWFFESMDIIDSGIFHIGGFSFQNCCLNLKYLNVWMNKARYTMNASSRLKLSPRSHYPPLPCAAWQHVRHCLSGQHCQLPTVQCHLPPGETWPIYDRDLTSPTTLSIENPKLPAMGEKELMRNLQKSNVGPNPPQSQQS